MFLLCLLGIIVRESGDRLGMVDPGDAEFQQVLVTLTSISFGLLTIAGLACRGLGLQRLQQRGLQRRSDRTHGLLFIGQIEIAGESPRSRR